MLLLLRTIWNATISQNVTSIQVPLAGHWIPEECPDFVVDQLFKFFGNRTR